MTYHLGVGQTNATQRNTGNEMETQLNALGDTVFETHRVAGREWYIVQAAHTNGMLFYVRPAQWEEGEVAGTLQFLAQCRKEIEEMKVCATDNVWFTTRRDEDGECKTHNAGANIMEFGANGNAIDLYEIWSKDGQSLIMSAWFACKSDADRVAYLMDGVADYQLTGNVRPE